MKFHVDGTLPTQGEVFVFGSNMAGRHGAGAALVARQRFGMEPHMWAGHWGQSYAIPTKDDNLVVLQPPVIRAYVTSFLMYAEERRELEFWVTRVGCGLAGYDDDEIAIMFKGAPENCSFAEAWRPYLVIEPPEGTVKTAVE
jgi:hypothetical protein